MITKISLITSVFPLFLLFSAAFSNQLYASDLNYDFNSDTELEDWIVSTHGGKVTTDGGILTLEAVNNVGFPYIVPKNLTFPDNNFYIEIKYQYAGDTKYGYGIGLNDTLPIDGRGDPLSNSDYIFVVWPGQFPTYGIGSAVCPINSSSCQTDSYFGPAYYGTFDTWNKARLEYSNNSYKLYIDDSLVFESGQSARKITKLWIGEFQSVSNLPWGKLKIDYIKSGLLSIPEADSKKRAVVVIPGLGGELGFWGDIEGRGGYGLEGAEFHRPL